MDQKVFSTVVLGVVVVLGVLIATLSDQDARAGCLWDRDTLRVEAAGAPGVAEVLTGRFDRFPPLYYEMRLERVAETLETEPGDLSLYDDAAVACDRLGRTDEAIGWMARKRTQLDHVNDPEHEYRYLANLGTFHAHRWIRNGADGTQLHDLQLAQALITQAIELNPDAHFGRERYQLMAISWLLEPGEGRGVDMYGADSITPSIFDVNPELQLTPLTHSIFGRDRLRDSGYGDAVEGLTGLMALGEAWQSVDVTFALQLALVDRGDANLGYFAQLRVRDLLASGLRSLHPAVDPDATSMSTASSYVPDDHSVEIRSYYQAAKLEAEAWHDSRSAYMIGELRQGRHPDTDPRFWAKWRPVSSPPSIPGRTRYGPVAVIGLAAVFVAGGTAVTLATVISRRRRAKTEATKVPA